MINTEKYKDEDNEDFTPIIIPFENWVLTLFNNGYNITPPKDVDTGRSDWDRVLQSDSVDEIDMSYEWGGNC